jgi:hypothetical protein
MLNEKEIEIITYPGKYDIEKAGHLRIFKLKLTREQALELLQQINITWLLDYFHVDTK